MWCRKPRSGPEVFAKFLHVAKAIYIWIALRIQILDRVVAKFMPDKGSVGISTSPSQKNVLLLISNTKQTYDSEGVLLYGRNHWPSIKKEIFQEIETLPNLKAMKTNELRNGSSFREPQIKTRLDTNRFPILRNKFITPEEVVISRVLSILSETGTPSLYI